MEMIGIYTTIPPWDQRGTVGKPQSPPQRKEKQNVLSDGAFDLACVSLEVKQEDQEPPVSSSNTQISIRRKTQENIQHMQLH